jgi:hypothetical protein
VRGGRRGLHTLLLLRRPAGRGCAAGGGCRQLHRFRRGSGEPPGGGCCWALCCWSTGGCMALASLASCWRALLRRPCRRRCWCKQRREDLLASYIQRMGRAIVMSRSELISPQRPVQSNRNCRASACRRAVVEEEGACRPPTSSEGPSFLADQALEVRRRAWLWMLVAGAASAFPRQLACLSRLLHEASCVSHGAGRAGN